MATSAVVGEHFMLPLNIPARQAEKELISDIAGGQGQAKNLTARQKTLDEQLQRQGELMYAVDFSLQVRAMS
jgi:hypothetical protein